MWRIQRRPARTFSKYDGGNFAMIYVQGRREKLDDQPYKNVCKKRLNGYKKKDDIVSSAIRVNGKDIHLEKQLLVKHFNGNL